MYAQVLHRASDVRDLPLSYEEVDQPSPSPNNVLIQTKVCGICRTDLHIVEGEIPLPALPIIPGHQVVGTVTECGPNVTSVKVGDRVGVAWLQATCGKCTFCSSKRENLCEQASFTGWTVPGGYAEYVVAPEQFIYPIPDGFTDKQAAPLLCAGIIGYRSLKLMQFENWSGKRIGIYGFGAAAHIAIQLLKAWGAEVYFCTRDQSHQALANELGAVWIEGTIDQPPALLDASVVFAPAGEIVPAALSALDRDGRLILAGIHMSPIPSFSYDILYGEKMIKSVTNNTKQDGLEFLDQAVKHGIQTKVRPFPLRDANEALCALKYSHIDGAGVLVVE